MQNMMTIPDWENVKEDMDKVGLDKMLRQVNHKKGAGENQHMLRIVQATNNAFMCWQQRDLVRTYHECFPDTLKVTVAVDIIIDRNIATAIIVLEAWGLDRANLGRITKEKREADFAEGEKHFRADVFSLDYWTTSTAN